LDDITSRGAPIPMRARLPAAAPALALPAVQGSGLIEACRRLSCILSLYALLTATALVRPVVPGGVYLALVVALIAAAWHMPKTDYRLYTLYILGFAMFMGLRVYADETTMPVSYVYPVSADRAVFGELPTTWLQEHLYSGQATALDIALIAVYTSYFMGHFWLGLFIWAFRRQYLRLHITAVLTVLAIGLLFYFLAPTSPPWLASQEGHLPEVTRIVHVTTSDLWAGANEQGTYIAGRNDVAAMPSLHTAITAVITLLLWRMNRLAGVAGGLYVAAMGFALVYLGEHYVIDVLAGIGAAVVAFRIAERILSWQNIWTIRNELQPLRSEAGSRSDRAIA